MKKKIIFLLLTAFLCCIGRTSFCQNEPAIPCTELPQKTTPAMAVNDFANIIENGAQARMEQEIRTYWDSTSIALTVFTVQNMNGNEVSEYALSLFRCWGVGGAGSNRGILFLISMDEHKLWIATGYGIEGILPDITCHKITESLVSLCKEGKYSDAVVAGVHKIFQTLGTMSWEERMEGIKAEKAADEKRWGEIKETAFDIIIVIGLIILLIVLIRRISKNIERKKLRKQMNDLILNMTKETIMASEKIAASVDTYKTQAEWAYNEAQSHGFEANGVLAKARNIITDAQKCYKENPEQAQTLLQKADKLIELSFNNFSKIDTGLKEKIKKFETEAPVRLAAAKKQVISALTALTECTKNGYRLAHAVSEQEGYQKLIEEYEGNSNNPEYHQLIYTKSEIIRTQSAESIEKVHAMVVKRGEVAESITPLIATGKKQYERAKQHVGMFDQYKAKYPESVWHQQEMLLKKLIGKLDPQRLDKLSAEIIDANSMVKQDFTAAALKYDELKGQIDQTETICTAATTIGVEQEKSRASYKSICNATEQLVAKALQKVKASDVSSTTRAKAKNAQQELERAKIQSTQSILDWVLLIVLLNSINDKANAAMRSAQIDIRDAENEREEEARRARNRRNSDSYSSFGGSSNSSYSSSYSSSDSSSSSFGGFGGGDSGGGGGGSSW
jgi:uncharacterized membrane protein YgcG